MKELLSSFISAAVWESVKAEVNEAVIEEMNKLSEDADFQAQVQLAVGAELKAAKTSIEVNDDTMFSSVYDFFDEFLAVAYPYTAMRAQQLRWTKRWWAHPEAVMRLTALWHRFEYLVKHEPATYLETFLRVHSDYHMRVLMAPDGIFDDSKREDVESLPLPTEPMPAPTGDDSPEKETNS